MKKERFKSKNEKFNPKRSEFGLGQEKHRRKNKNAKWGKIFQPNLMFEMWVK